MQCTDDVRLWAGALGVGVLVLCCLLRLFCRIVCGSKKAEAGAYAKVPVEDTSAALLPPEPSAARELEAAP